MASEKFCLRWNDFETNISSAFKELREEKDFFDITLACDDSQIQAHKVILSACSPFFRNVLRRNPHQHPLLYLKGVKYQDMISVLNFMYNGEVNVAQEELNSFLSVAEDLRVRGLTQENSAVSQKASRVQESHPPERTLKKPSPPDLTVTEREPPMVHAKRSRQTPYVTQPEKQYQGRFEDNEIQELVPVKAEPRETLPPQHPVERSNMEGHVIASEPIDASYSHSTVALDQSYVEDETYGYEDYGEGYENSMMNTSIGGADGSKDLEYLIQSKMVKIPGETSLIWQCVDCEYSSKLKHNVFEHVESKHIQHDGYLCTICNKTCPSQSALRMHNKRKHNILR